MFRATLVYLFMGSYVLFVGLPAILWSLLAGETRTIYRLARFCIRASCLLCGVRVIISGEEKVQPDQAYLFLSNHQGNFDAPVLAHAVPRDFRAIVKKEMMRIPLLSLVLKCARFVPIDRSDPGKARASIDLAALYLSEGASFVAFPEGTRSRDGHLGEFKKGAFVMAIKAGAPIVPITIRNSGRVQPPGSYAIRPGTVEVVFHNPIETSNMTMEDRDKLVELTRNAIASGLPQ